MSLHDEIGDLLLRWEEARELGTDLTPEELCRETPELLVEVRQRILGMQKVDHLIDSTSDGQQQSAQSTTDCAKPDPYATTPLQEVSSTPPPGQIVVGYEILGVLGRGGMGVVYKARQIRLNRVIALKMILAGSHSGPGTLRRFQVEAEAVARLQHPNIMQIHEFGEADGKPYFSLEFLEGGSLDKKIGGQPQPADEAARLVRTLALAMHAAHEKGIVHRDLKPANVLLASDGTPKIGDFGLAKQLGADSGQTLEGAVMGTPSYMAPEQAAGQISAIGPATDVYALGAILYELLTGRPPFRGSHMRETLDQVLSREPVSPRALRPKVARDLETICLKCLQKIPKYRYSTALALADDLTRFLEDRPVLARPVSRAQRLMRWCRRKPKDTALASLILVILVLTVGGTCWATIDKARKAKEQADLETTQAEAQAQKDLAQTYYLRGRGFFEQDLNKEAIKEWQEAIRLNPDQAEYHNSLGDALDLTDRLDEAQAAYVAAIQVAPNFAVAHRNLGLIFYQKKRFEDAITAYRNAIQIEPEFADAYADLGEALQEVAKFDLEIQAIQEAIRIKPENAEYRNKLGIALYKVGRLEEEIAAYREAIRLKPDFAAAHNNLGLSLKKKGQLDQAISKHMEAIRLSPNNADFHNNLGLALRANGRAEEAAKEFRIAVRFNSENAYFQNNLGGSLHDQLRYKEASVFFREAIRLKPDNASFHRDMGLAHLYKGRLNEAILAFHEAVRLMPDYGNAYASLGWALYHQGRLEEAVPAFREALRLKPEFPYAHQGLGLTLLAKGQLEGALRAFNKALRPNPQDPYLCNTLGYALTKAFRFEEARDFFLVAHEQGAKNPKWREPSAFRVSYCEKMARLEPDLARVLSGQIKVADASDLSAFARLCYFKGLYVNSIALYSEAFKKDPELLKDLPAYHLGYAACATSWACGEKGTDAARMNSADRIKFGKQAREWLSLGLDLGESGSNPSLPTNRALLLRTVRSLLCDCDLAGVREPEAMTLLPEEERQAWQEFWTRLRDWEDRMDGEEEKGP